MKPHKPTWQDAANRDQLYGRRWRSARKAFLRDNPVCVMCQQDGIATPASVVDHMTPHKGDPGIFWDQDKWQPLCQPCHDRHKQRQEKSGKTPLRFTDDGQVIWPDR